MLLGLETLLLCGQFMTIRIPMPSSSGSYWTPWP